MPISIQNSRRSKTTASATMEQASNGHMITPPLSINSTISHSPQLIQTREDSRFYVGWEAPSEPFVTVGSAYE
jgi:hypothetical protein